MCEVCEHIKGNSAQMVLERFGKDDKYQLIVKMGKLICNHYEKGTDKGGFGGHYKVDFEIPINYCPKCGCRTFPNVCPCCRKRVEDDWEFCPYCSEQLKEGK